MQVKERKKPFIVEVKNGDLNCYYGDVDSVDVLLKLNGEIMNKIISGNETFQRAFMSGDMQVKGDFKMLRQLDQMFVFIK